MKDVRSEKTAVRSLERAHKGREQSRPAGLLRPSNPYEMGFNDSPLATDHYSCISTRFCPKSRSHTKHTTKPSLPGSRFACCRPRTSFANALSNRELHLLEPTLTHGKQTIAPRSNRELSTNPLTLTLASTWHRMTGNQ
jgi:hypothetical protein